MPEVTRADVSLLRQLHDSPRPLTIAAMAGPRTRQTLQWRLGRLRKLGYVASTGPRPFHWDVTAAGVEFISGSALASRWRTRWHLVVNPR